MGKKKLIRFAENNTFSHLFQYSFDEIRKGFPLKGRWQQDYFHNENPITLELGCGKGEYTVHLARKYPGRNFIGVDIKGARLWRGCKTVEEEKLSNVAFIRTRIQLINAFFEMDEVKEIWLTFPDPQPRKSKEKKRLTSPAFLNRYAEILDDSGLIHLKTDDEGFYNYTLDLINTEGYTLVINEPDLYKGDFEGDARDVKTFYERMFLEGGNAIKYLQFRLRHDG